MTSLLPEGGRFDSFVFLAADVPYSGASGPAAPSDSRESCASMVALTSCAAGSLIVTCAFKHGPKGV